MGYGDLEKGIRWRRSRSDSRPRSRRNSGISRRIPDEVEAVLRDGAARARALAAPVLAAARKAAGLSQ